MFLSTVSVCSDHINDDTVSFNVCCLIKQGKRRKRKRRGSDRAASLVRENDELKDKKQQEVRESRMRRREWEGNVYRKRARTLNSVTGEGAGDGKERGL